MPTIAFASAALPPLHPLTAALRRSLAGFGAAGLLLAPLAHAADAADDGPKGALVEMAAADSADAASGTDSGIATVNVTGVRDDDDYSARSASTATRLPLSLRETPQSISVISQAEIRDFALQSVNELLTHATGINVERVETDRTYYTARGFDITNFQVDGIGVPFSGGNQWGDVDTAIYERVEVLRGANGLMSSVGNPSATINFIRKRPTAESQGSVDLTLGSWNARRLDVDVSGALNGSGSIRGRVVGAAEHSDSYLDRYSRNKTVGYGVVDFDLDADTTLTVGFSQQDNDADGVMWGALPLYYSDGSPTRYDVSASTAADWSYWDNRDQRGYVELTHEFGRGWQAKAEVTARKLTSDSNLFYVYGTPDRDTGSGLLSYPSQFTGDEKQWIADAYASGPFSLFGRRHELVVGANWSRADTTQVSLYNYSQIGLAVPEPDGWDGSFPKPVYDPTTATGADFVYRRESLYAAAHFSILDSLKLLTGVNFTHAEAEGENYGVANAYSRDETTPYVGLVWDVARHYSLYASYAKIFNPQSEVDVNHRILDPIDGSNLEGGIKGEWFDQRLNASLAVFRVEQNNTAQAAGYDEHAQAYYAPSDATSTGFEFDMSGEILPGWALSTGYTQMDLEDPDGHDTRTFVPRKSAKLTTSYRLPMLAAVKIGTSLRWQDAISYDQGVTSTTTGAEIVTRQDAYLLLGLMASYDITAYMTLTVNGNNLTDEKYLTSLYWSQSYYAAPRNVSATLSWRF